MSFNWPVITLCAVGISLLLTAIVIPQILHVATAKRLFDRQDARKVHKGSVPRLGGFAFFPVMVMTLGITLIMPAAYAEGGLPLGASQEFIMSLPDIMVLLAAMAIMFLTGLYDDLLGVKYSIKFIAQLACAVMLVQAGLYVVDYDDLFGIGLTTHAMGKIITAFLIVYIINGLNLIDGIDGLAAGLSAVALAYFGWVLSLEGLHMFSLLAWIAAASMVVFWFFNVFGSNRRHTKIFMGDIGSLCVGLLVAFMMIVVGRGYQSDSAWGLRPMVLALSPLVLPLLDVVRVFFVRIIHRRSPFLPDKRHIHHLMLAAGMSMRLAMAALILAQIAFVALNLWLSESWGINVVLILDVVLYALMAGVLSWGVAKEAK